MRTVALAVVIVGVSLAAGEPEKGDTPRAKPLWAAISVSHPVFDAEVWSQRPFLLHLALVNDGEKIIDPELDSSQLIVNGKEVGDDWTITIGNGPRDDRIEALPPGDHLEMTISFGRDFREALARHFREPGIYHVSWKGKRFESPAIVFRVMPRKKN
jgi:hypothetical protein